MVNLHYDKMVNKLFIRIIILLEFFAILLLLSTWVHTPIRSNINVSYELINESLLEVANHEFIPYFYDCSQFAKALVKNLASKNITSYCITGSYADGGHVWVVVNNTYENIYLESTNGEFITEWEYNTYYKEELVGWCI